MKKLLTVIALFLAAQCVFAQKADLSPNIKRFKNDTIVWHPDSLLRKEDFKSKHSSSAYGLSNTGIFLYQKERDGNLNFYVEAIFIKSKSYLKTVSEYVLKHEQLHFDICEFYARKLRQKIAQLDFKKVKNVAEVVKNLYEKIANEQEKYQNKYDNDTEHGLNGAKQEMWTATVQKELKELEGFSATEVVITGK